MSKSLGPFIATSRYAVVFGMLPKRAQAAFNHIKTPQRAYRAESSKHISLKCGIYIMHKERNATAQQEWRRRKRKPVAAEGEISISGSKSDRRIES